MTRIFRLGLPSLPLAFTLVLIGCDSSTSPCIEAGPDSSLAPIEGQVRFYVAERHLCLGGVCEPSIMLLMYTEKIYPCYNYLLETDVSVNGKLVTVDLRGVNMFDFCLTAPGPATSKRVLELTPGEYKVRFLLGCKADSYELCITDEAIRVRRNRSRFTTSLAELVWRFPHNSFGYFCGTTAETSWMCDAFLDSLLVTARFEEFVFPDSGGIPFQGYGGFHCDMPARYFRYVNEADFDTAGAILKRFSTEVTSQYSGVGLQLWGWNNKRFLSWMLEDENLKEYPSMH